MSDAGDREARRDDAGARAALSGALAAHGKAVADMSLEARISRLARWVLDASHSGQTFGLRLPATVLAPAAGAAHEEQCLTALALLEL